MMAADVPGMILFGVAVMLVWRAAVVAVRVSRGLVRISRRAGERRKRCGQSLQRQQQKNHHGKLFTPAFHERLQSIEKPKALQPGKSDSTGAGRF